jgi:hypothetical protein
MLNFGINNYYLNFFRKCLTELFSYVHVTVCIYLNCYRIELIIDV